MSEIINNPHGGRTVLRGTVSTITPQKNADGTPPGGLGESSGLPPMRGYVGGQAPRGSQIGLDGVPVPLGPSVQRGSVHENLQGQQGTFTGIRSKAGSMQSLAEITPESIVGVPGVGDMSLQSALSAGFARADGRGGFTTNMDGPLTPDATSESEEPDPAANNTDEDGNDDELHPDLVVEALADPALDSEVTDFTDGASEDLQSAVIAEMSVVNGELSEATIGKLASEIGVMPEEAAAKFAAVRVGFEDQARAAVRDVVGVLPDNLAAPSTHHSPPKAPLQIGCGRWRRIPSGWSLDGLGRSLS